MLSCLHSGQIIVLLDRPGVAFEEQLAQFAFAFRLLAPLKRLRGTALDPFGWTAERRMERRLIGEFETLLAELADHLTPDRRALAVELASLPQQMRGFGHVKTANVEKAKAKELELLAVFRSGTATLLEAAE